MIVGLQCPDLLTVLRRVTPGWNLSLKAKELITIYFAKYKCLGAGGSRVTFDVGNGLVVKVPFSDNWYNESEAKKSEESASSGKHDLAQAVTICEDGVLVLIMEKVTPIENDSEIPHDKRNWAHNFDCAQVGWTADGRLVAYDYA